ncbi:hypothetical protein GCM10027277_53390 [Pseudoduganella ginsengisoli]
MNALAPSISHAIAFSQGVPATWEICRADGSRVTVSGLITGEDSGKSSGKAKAMGEDCAYCQTHAGSFGLPPVTLSSLPDVGMQLTPFLFYHAPQPLSVWATAQPRGPPAHV